MTIDIFLTKEQIELKERYRDLIKKVIIPRVKEIDETDAMPPDLIQQLI
ncbi:unnamed protein product, partial [marine sediment metagenome]